MCVFEKKSGRAEQQTSICTSVFLWRLEGNMELFAAGSVRGLLPLSGADLQGQGKGREGETNNRSRTWELHEH